IRAAMEQRPRVVICQKPFCQTLEEAKAAVALGAEAGIPLVIHENFRFQPWYRVIRQTINDGAIGDLLQVTFRFRPGDGQGPHAYLDRQPYFQKMQRFLVHETAVHWIDTFRFLMGKPNAVFAELRQLNPAIAGEDAGFILFSYDDGRRALFDGNRLLDHSARDTRCTMGEALVEGTTGSLHLSGDGSVACRRFGEEAFAELYRPDNVQGFGGDCVFHLCKHVVDGLNGRTEFENEAHDYLFTLRVEEAVYRSAELGKMIKVG
ncbi:MAG: Gfo/Idh/MocA family oxidoreductase, partial [Pseudomonadota bacterium]